MRLAFVTSLLPTGKPDTGFEIATTAILNSLREAGCELTLFGVLRPNETADNTHDCVVLDRMIIENAVAGVALKAQWLAASAWRNLPVIAAKLAPLAGRLTAAMAEHGPFDACIVNSAPVAAAFPHLFRTLPCLLVAHNVEHASAAENARATAGVTRMLYAREARLLKREEDKALAASRFVFCLAEEDRASFGLDDSTRSAVFPLLVPEPATLADMEPRFDLGLIGTWTWQPNLIGLRWFLDEVAPKLPPDISIGIAGRLPEGLAPALPQVQLLGRVSDAGTFVASCRAMALTSRSGTGIQLKSIETFQMGKPCVATRSSVRGFHALPMNCLVADDAERFAAAAVKLIKDIRSERSVAGNGSAFVSGQREGMRAAVRAGLAVLATKG